MMNKRNIGKSLLCGLVNNVSTSINSVNGKITETSVSESFTQIRDNITDIHQSSDAIETEIKKVDAIATDMAATTQEQTA